MKITNDMVFIGIILFIFMFLSLGMSCSSVSPYHKDNLFPRNFVYEPLSNYEPMMTYSEYQSGEQPAQLQQQQPAQVQEQQPSKKVEGFQGLQSSPIAEEKPIDIFSQNSGSLTCPSYGYYNSKGQLCLDDAQVRLLKTRGANSTGRADEIGH
jgi:hypothetical protein